MFYGDFQEKGKEEIELKDVSHEEFIELLYVIYPSYRPISMYTYRFIADLADRFQMKYAMDRVEEYLTRAWAVNTMQKLVVADEFRLDVLKMHCLQKYTSLKEIKALESLPEFKAFSHETKSAFCLRLLELIE
ncbi:hypothetical protein PFISCL1PPCAC_20970 [Pristionchus fissidentatus]|uniref:BTB domain-containing protein n=1 Tax=Pristionchus fissidentatus TaxID=1538716 RepID=A0AAV5WDW7_9BILA|nr:hypothetical protein PFISCL1PPCAC_20970 [Pristionchus fissidentatus]